MVANRCLIPQQQHTNISRRLSSCCCAGFVSCDLHASLLMWLNHSHWSVILQCTAFFFLNLLKKRRDGHGAVFRFPYLDSAANGVAITHLIVPTVLPNFLSMSVNTQIVLLSVNKISLEMHHRLYMKRDAPSLILIFHFLGKTFISLNGQMSSNQFSNKIK